MLICQRIVICISLFLSVYTHAKDCSSAKLIGERGTELFERDQFLLSSLHFSKASALSCNTELKQSYLYKYSISMLELNEFTEVEFELSKLAKVVSTNKRSKVNLLKNLYLNSNSPLSSSDSKRLQIWKNKDAVKDLEEISLTDLSIHQKNAVSEYINKAQDLELKSPVLAGTLSLIPGLGQTYLGAYQSAAISFVINSLFYMTAKDFEKRNQYNAANAAYLVFSITYVGNILNSVNMTNRVNKNRLNPHQESLKKELFKDLQEL